MFKRLLVLLCLALLLCACAKNKATTTNASLVWAGLYKTEAEETFKEKASNGWYRKKRTAKIPNVMHTRFGIEYKLASNAFDPLIKHTLVWRYPEGGQKNPDKKTATEYEEYDRTCVAGEICQASYAFDYEWEPVPGKWYAEVWVDDKCLIRQAFYVQEK